MNTSPAVWVEGIVTLIALSSLYKHNKAYALVQAAFVGAAAGYGVTLGIENIISVGVTPLRKGNPVFIIPLLLGALLLTRYRKSMSWLAAYPMQFLIGIGTGLAIRGTVRAEILSQIIASMAPLKSINSFVVTFATFTVIGYFVFTIGVDNKTVSGGVLRVVRDLGRYCMMVMFGAGFASALQGRISLLIARFQFVFQDWFGL